MSKRKHIEDLGASRSNNIMSNPIIEFLDLPDMDAQDPELRPPLPCNTEFLDLLQDPKVFLKSTLIYAKMMAKCKFGAEKL